MGGGLRPGIVIPLHEEGQEPNETFGIRWELTSKPYVASIHTITNYVLMARLQRVGSFNSPVCNFTIWYMASYYFNLQE